jgi:DHA1 family bicyclomycin/chloramphenicol resistance-like MFS transporter
MPPTNRHAGSREFIALCAFLMATIALAVDMMLPALDAIALDLDLTDPAQKPGIILSIFGGLVFGQLLFGPLSDAVGRRLAILIGMILFLIGTAICAYSDDYPTLITGRFIQGFGASAARIVTQAMIRDRFSGTEMARVMSFVMTIFIVVPVFAPMAGQVILWFGDWHVVFVCLGVFSGGVTLWFGLRQPETINQRRPFSASRLKEATVFVVQTHKSMRFTLAAGISFGGLLSYLASAQPIFQSVYQTGEWFPVLFGLSAAFIALSSIVNAHIVRDYGMERICRVAFITQITWTALHLLVLSVVSSMTLIVWMMYITPVLFLMGLTFANLQAVAMQPMGHIAGVASTIIGSMMTGLSLMVGFGFSLWFENDVTTLLITFMLTGLVARVLIQDELFGRRVPA